MRNPFRRQTQTAAPSLHERAANLSARLAASKPQTETATASAAHDNGAIQSDPALTTIEEGRRLLAVSRDAFKLPDVGIDPHPARDAAQDAVWAHFRGTVAKVIPSTARGCAALAQYATEFQNFQGVEIGEEALEILGHIARSPMLDVEAQADALPTVILNSWAAWGAVQDRLRGEGTDAEVEATLAPMNRLVGSVADLPATAENIAAKALAAAWSEWVFAERHEAPRSAYPADERCLFDIHAAIMARGSQDTTLRPTPSAFDFGPDAHIAELAAEFCEAYAANIKADREHMAERMSEAEWLPHYQRATALMRKLEATEPKTILGMALKCLGPIGAAGYNAPADESETQDETWERVGTQFANAVLRDALAPLPTADWHASPVDLIAAAGLSVKALSIFELSALFDAAYTLSDVACAMTCQPRHSVKGGDFNGAGLFMESLTHALNRTIEAVAKELRSRTPADEADRAERLETLARITVQSDDNAETAAFARELLAMVVP